MHDSASERAFFRPMLSAVAVLTLFFTGLTLPAGRRATIHPSGWTPDEPPEPRAK